MKIFCKGVNFRRMLLDENGNNGKSRISDDKVLFLSSMLILFLEKTGITGILGLAENAQAEIFKLSSNGIFKTILLL